MGKISPRQRFSKWTAIKTVRVQRPSGRTITKWLCKCDCGTEALVNGHDLNKNKSTQCLKCGGNCLDDISKKKFGKWLVIERDLQKQKNASHWICRCDCGNTVSVCAASLKAGASTRCSNCYHKSKRTHHLSTHPLFHTWINMINRCEDPCCHSYHSYGGRGISVCERWHDVSAFIEDVGNRPPESTLDRIDNDGMYEPKNCRWATYKQQARNRRTTKCLTLNGTKKPICDWADDLKVNGFTLRAYSKKHTEKETYEHFSRSNH